MARTVFGGRRSIAVALLVAAGLAGGIASDPQVAAADAPVVEVVVEQYAFRPAELKVRTGTTVRWLNREPRTSHSIRWEEGPESDRFFPGERYERRFERAGRYMYSCGPHPEMKGIVIVTD
jgi:plastocyanin